MSGFVVPLKNGGHRAVVTHSAKSKLWEKEIRKFIKDVNPLVGAVSIELWFFMDKPKSVKNRTYPSVVPDLDKLDRAVMDGLKDIWEDDSRVVDIDTHKRYSTEDFPAGVLIRIQEKVDNWESEHDLLKGFREQYRRDAIHDL